MIRNERSLRHESVVEVARRMMLAARTAPKGKGVDIIEIVLVSDRADLEVLSDAMRRKGEKTGMKFLLRDADNILQGEALLLIGTRSQVQGLNCCYCGFPTCGLKPDAVPCAINSIDVGIAVGSACSVAADMRVDTRVMFSSGWASLDLGWLPDCSQVIGIALSASSKNPFFDRKPKEQVSNGEKKDSASC